MIRVNERYFLAFIVLVLKRTSEMTELERMNFYVFLHFYVDLTMSKEICFFNFVLSKAATEVFK